MQMSIASCVRISNALQCHWLKKSYMQNVSKVQITKSVIKVSNMLPIYVV